MDERPYRMGDLEATLGLSRSTLLYYEQLGLVSPYREDEASGHRRYSDRDMHRLMLVSMFKNIGVPVKDLAALFEGDPFSDTSFGACFELLDRRLTYVTAQREQLGRLKELRDAPQGRIELADIEEYYLVPDSAERGYREFPPDEALVTLLAHMPIGGLGAHYHGDWLSGECESHWGRTVPVRFANLLPLGEVSPAWKRLGGCRCLCIVSFSEDLHDTAQREASDRAAAGAFLEEHGLRVAGEAFRPYSLFSDRGFYSRLCVPVEPVRRSLPRRAAAAVAHRLLKVAAR